MFYFMKTITKVLSLILALTLLLSFPVAASAAELANVPTIDESKTGSLTIYKYDLTNAEKDGIWDSSYVSTGVYDEAGVNNVLGGNASSTLGNGETGYGYAIKGVEFTYVKVADILQYEESESDNRTDAHVEVLYAVDKTNGADFLAALGLAEGKNRYENADVLDESKYFYQSDVLTSALSAGLTANYTTVKNAMERYAATNGTAMPLTDSYGKSKVENLPLGLYLVAETKVPEAYLKSFDTFLLGRDCKNSLSKELMLEWIAPKAHQKSVTIEHRIHIMQRFADFLNRNGFSAYRIPSELIPRKVHDFVPYIFTYDEIARILAVVDGFQFNKRSPKSATSSILCCSVSYAFADSAFLRR